MWIMCDSGFISIVQHRDDPSILLVRARVREDINNTFGQDIEVVEVPGSDYLYRAVISRKRVAETMAMKVMELDYDSHAKDVAIARSSKAPGRSGAYYATWTAMARMQEPYAPYSTTPRAKIAAAKVQAPLWSDQDYDIYGDVTAARKPGQWFWNEDDTPSYTNVSFPAKKHGKKGRKGGRK